jgi:uncharacterized protein YndB with AHSA1/START domain
MARTGESYTAARRVLIAAGDRPEPKIIDFVPPLPDETAARATGHGWQHWFDLLDAWGATAHTHGEIARWLSTEHRVPDWWTQSVTVAYERARGLRAPGQNAQGWMVSATKTINIPVERLWQSMADDALRDRWLLGAELRLRTATAPRSARYDWEDGSSRVYVSFEALADAKSRIAIQHERLPDSDARDEMKAWWRDRLSALRLVLENP